jgi:hypothetical protein
MTPKTWGASKSICVFLLKNDGQKIFLQGKYGQNVLFFWIINKIFNSISARTDSATILAAIMLARWASLPLHLLAPSLRIRTGTPASSGAAI